MDLGHISHSVNLKISENSDMGLFMSASDDSDLDSMSGEESVPGDSDSSMPVGDSEEGGEWQRIA